MFISMLAMARGFYALGALFFIMAVCSIVGGLLPIAPVLGLFGFLGIFIGAMAQDQARL